VVGSHPLYGLLLRFLPKSFRYEYGGEMRRIFADRMRKENPLLLWAEAIPDLLWTALCQHAALLRQDVRFALRSFRRAPGYAAAAVFTVALGIAASTAMFTAVDHVLIRPLPYAEPGRLVHLWEDASQFGWSSNEPAVANYLDWKAGNTVFEGMAADRGLWTNLTGDGPPERLEGAAVEWDLFPLLGVQPLLGRWFLTSEDAPNGPRVAILSYGLWQRRFGGEVSVPGRDILLDGAAYRVVGIMPPQFPFPRRDVEIWLPMRFTTADKLERDNNYIHVTARLKRGVTLAAARAQMKVADARIIQAHSKESNHVGIVVRPLREELSSNARLALWTLLCAAGCVLLIGCANLANLLLARSSERRKELAVRAMLGAGRERLVRQILTENLVLSCTGGCLGMVVAEWCLPLLGQLVPENLPVSQSLHSDWRVLLFGITLSAVTAFVFAWAPAWRLSREADLSSVAKEGSRSGLSGHRGRMRRLLVIGEVAASVVLLVCTSLLLEALSKIYRQDPGFDATHVLTLRTSLAFPKYDSASSREQYYERVLQGVRSLPGVQAAGFVSFLPLTMRGGVLPVTIPGEPPGKPEPIALFRVVTDGYFEAMKIPLLNGPYPNRTDTAASLPVAFVSRSFARRHWPDRNPLGRTFVFAEQTRTVVGVVADLPLRGLERKSEPQIYLPYRQLPGFLFHMPKDLALRTDGDPLTYAGAVRRIIYQVDPDQPVSDVQLMTHLLEQDTSARRLQLRLLGGFALITFLLAGVGLHGLLSFVVAQRHQEIGLRMALGARYADVLWMVLRQGSALALYGIGAGTLLAVAAGRMLERLLFGVSPTDALSFAVSIVLCLSVSLLACYLPARRAAGVDPILAIRKE
jgi:predicted permease